MENITVNEICKPHSEETFRDLAIRIFQFQYVHCDIYRQFVNGVAPDINNIQSMEDIPFLPIDFFKTQRIISSSNSEEIIFESSGTTGSQPSKHYVADLSLYEQSFLRSFQLFVGNPKDFAILSLLPSYIERGNSSLLYMMDVLMQKSQHPLSGFYLNDTQKLVRTLKQLDAENQKTILWGVSFALLDLVENFSLNLPNLMVFETGGMKGRRKEMLREELHILLKQGFGVQTIHSEYGMTELLSQAYLMENQRFKTPPWMKIRIRDAYNPLRMVSQTAKSGGINVIDLANVYSCSFIATQDIGKLYSDQTFEVLGRFDVSDVRGCNLMVY